MDTKFDYWMLNTIIEALTEKHDRYIKSAGIAAQLAKIQLSKGREAALQSLKEIQANRLHPLGQMFLARQRAEKMREEISAKADKIEKEATDGK